MENSNQMEKCLKNVGKSVGKEYFQHFWNNLGWKVRLKMWSDYTIVRLTDTIKRLIKVVFKVIKSVCLINY